jgi:activating signal cointegrator 1
MKALSLIQPWATGIMAGNKKIETRSWKTDYRGRIAIHASKGFPKWAREFAETEAALGRIPSRLPFSQIVGFATITDMRRTEEIGPQITALERLYGDYSPGRWGWLLEDIIPLELPIPCKGALGLWEVPEGIVFRPACKMLPAASFLPYSSPAIRKLFAVAAGPELTQFAFPFASPKLKADQ